jgi:hypothetical protein
VQTVRAKDTGFRLVQVGWGQFEIVLQLGFRDGQRREARYMLTFDADARSTVALA